MRARKSRGPAWAALLVVCGCRDPLVLPDLPAAPDQPPRIAGVAPRTAFAEAKVVITGANLAGLQDAISVRFGEAQPVRPEAVAPDGTRLEVRVPDDATSGAVRVTTPGGEAVGGPDLFFTFAGAGRLRYGRPSVGSDLRPLFQVQELAPAGTYLLAANDGVPLLELADGTHRLLDDPVPHALAPFDAGRAFVATFAEPLPGCAGHSLRIWRDLAPAPALCVQGAAGSWAADVAVDDAGTHLLVVATDAAWLVDLAAATSQRFLSGGRSWGKPAWLGGTRFVFAEDTGLRMVDWQDGVLRAAAALPGAQGEEYVWPTARDGRIAASHGTRLVLLDAPDWPPVVRREFPSLCGRGALPAFSDDLRRLLVSDQEHGRLVTFDLTRDEPAPLALVEAAQRSGTPARGRLGTFVVGIPAGRATLAQETGMLLERRLVDAGLGPPQAVRMNYAEREAGHAILSRTFQRVLFLAEDNRSLLATGPAPGAEEMRAVPEAPLLRYYLRAGARVWRMDCSPEREETCEPDGWAWQPADAVTDAPAQLALAPDGTAVLLAYRATDGEAVVFLDTAADPDAEVPALYAGAPVRAMAVAATGRAMIVTDERRLFVDVAQTLRTGERVLLRDTPFDALERTRTLRRLAAGPGFFLEFSSDAAGGPARTLRLEDAQDGHVVAQRPLSAYVETQDQPGRGPLWSWQVSPGGRRAWWLTGRAGEERIVTLKVDPETGVTDRADPPIAVPGAGGLLPFPDGERLSVAKPEGIIVTVE